ncbi:hypothetical protein C0J52_09886 [Blattella germanica]|nr:hypothetical protein C0J52_09886 [Blattella germanica]
MSNFTTVNFEGVAASTQKSLCGNVVVCAIAVATLQQWIVSKTEIPNERAHVVRSMQKQNQLFK